MLGVATGWKWAEGQRPGARAHEGVWGSGLVGATGWEGRGGSRVAPVLARLSFWTPPGRTAEFAADYEAKVAPILKRHGLVPSSERGRATPEGIFSRLLEVKSPLEVEERRKAFQADPLWRKTLRDLGAAFGTVGPDSLIRHDFELYAAPAGPGKVLPASVGKVLPAGEGTGHWRTYDMTDGLAGGDVRSILQDREGYLWFGTEHGVSRYDGQTWVTFTTRDGLADNSVWSIVQDRGGHLWFGTYSGVSRYDGRSWTTFTAKDGLANKVVRSSLQDREGHLWFGTRGGVSRYDGRSWTTFTAKDIVKMQVDKSVWSVFQDQEGDLWISLLDWGVSRYDGRSWTAFTVKDGLANNQVFSILQDRGGRLWFGTRGGGVSRYDGRSWATFTAKEGLANNRVLSGLQDREGRLWFGTYGGVSRYDGRSWTTFTAKDGLAGNLVRSMFQDRDGYLWLSTDDGGASRYDGQHWVTFTAKDGLASSSVYAIFQDREGHLWFGTDRGVSRYAGQTWTTFTTRDGLAHDLVFAIFQDREGHLWFGTRGGGVSRYDGQVFQTLTRWDGLAGNSIYAIFQDQEGHLWFGTEGRGVTRYRPPAPSPPPVFIDAVVADRRYERVSQLMMPSNVKLTAFEFHGISFKTRPEQMIYRYRLKGYDKGWRTTHARRVEYQDLPRETYTFEVVAVDRDLVYSEKPATVTLRVHLPYEQIGLLSALGIAVALVAWQTARVVRRDRLLQVSNAALSAANQELFGLNQELREKTGALAEANVRLQEVDAVKTDFFSNVSHELRTPMTAIKGYADNLLDGIAGGLTERQGRYIGRIRANADRLTRLINDLLDLSRIDRGRKDLLQLNIQKVLVQETVFEAVESLRPMAEAEGLQLRFEGEEAYGLADRDRLVQVVTNLVGNAIKFTPSGGSVEVMVEVTSHESRVTVQETMDSEARGLAARDPRPATLGDGFVVVGVQDTGRGIPAEDLERIFDRFYQVKGGEGHHPGTGLGLPIAKELVELMGGRIWAESEVGMGSAFWFTLPEVKT